MQRLCQVTSPEKTETRLGLIQSIEIAAEDDFILRVIVVDKPIVRLSGVLWATRREKLFQGVNLMVRRICGQSVGWQVAFALFAVGYSTATTGQTAYAQNKARGAVLGGLGGAVVGGLIGDHNGKAGAGAAIGGAIGAVGGAVLGNARDQEIAQQRQYQYQVHQQRVYAQQQQQQALIQSAVSTSDIVTMSRSGLSDSVIINQIHSRGVQRQLQVSDIISLHQQGVSESVITAMQNARIGSSQETVVVQQTPVIVQQPPVIVQERYVVPQYGPPTYYQYQRGYYRGF